MQGENIVEEQVQLGTRFTVLGGVSIRGGTMIGACAFVPRDIQKNKIMIYGILARVKKTDMQ